MSASNLNPTPFLDNDESEAPIYPFFHDPTDERYTIFDFSTGFPDCTVQVSDNYSQSSMTNVDETRDTSIPAASRNLPNHSLNSNVTTPCDSVNHEETACSTSDADFQLRSFRKRPRRNASHTLACPYFKEDVLQNRTPKCNSVPAQDMSGVRQHLKRNHKINVKLCRRCNKDFVGRTEHMGCTIVIPQRRRDKADTQWRSLYAKLFPNSTPIPSPYNNTTLSAPKDIHPFSHSLSTLSLESPCEETIGVAFQCEKNFRSAHIDRQSSLDHGRIFPSLDKALDPIYKKCRYFVQGIEGEMQSVVPKSQHRTAISGIGSSIADQLDAICRNPQSEEPSVADSSSVMSTLAGPPSDSRTLYNRPQDYLVHSFSPNSLEGVLDSFHLRISRFVQILEEAIKDSVPKEQLQNAKYLVGASIVRQLESICPDLGSQEFGSTLPSNTHSITALEPQTILSPRTGVTEPWSSASLRTSANMQRQRPGLPTSIGHREESEHETESVAVDSQVQSSCDTDKENVAAESSTEPTSYASSDSTAAPNPLSSHSGAAFQPETGHATQLNNRRNDNKFCEQTDRYSLVEHIHPYSSFFELSMRDSINQAQTTDTNGYKDRTSSYASSDSTAAPKPLSSHSSAALQPETGHATQRNNRHNNNTVCEQTDQYSRAEHVYGSRNNGNIGHFSPSDPDPRMETEEKSGNGSLGQVDGNGSLHRSTYPHSSRKDSLSQPCSYNGATIPHLQQYYPTTIQQQGQSRSYTDYQPAAGYATQCNDRHNGNTVDKQLDQYSHPNQVYPYSPFVSLLVRDLINQAQTRDTNVYKDSTSVPQPNHYPFLGPQADLGQLSQYGKDTISRKEPWSPLNSRIDCPPLRIELTEIEDLRRLRDSDSYSSARTGSRAFSNASSDGDRWTTDSSVGPSTNDLSDSTTTLRPTPQIVINRDMFILDTFEPHLPQNRSHSLGSGFGTRPTFSAHGTSHLKVPHHQPQADPVDSLLVSAPSSSLINIARCDVPRCSETFSGQYRAGNLARHTRLKHGSLEKVYRCEVPACRKDFKRQDARLKHYRKHHPELRSSPVIRRTYTKEGNLNSVISSD